MPASLIVFANGPVFRLQTWIISIDTHRSCRYLAVHGVMAECTEQCHHRHSQDIIRAVAPATIHHRQVTHQTTVPELH